jgi:hypothetical protein
LRDDNAGNHHGVVRLSESPLYLILFWRKTAADEVHSVGVFRLDLPELLKDGYIRYEPVDLPGPDVRLRVVRTHGHFYVQVNDDGPRALMV